MKWNVSVLFIDLDGTLINTMSGRTFPMGIWDMMLNLRCMDKIKQLKPECVCIVSNQGGISQGYVDEGNFKHKLRYVVKAVEEYTKVPTASCYTSSADKDNNWRKPNTGMLETLPKESVPLMVEDIDTEDKSRMLMVGDASGREGQFSDSDLKTAQNFKIDYLDVEDFIELDLSE